MEKQIISYAVCEKFKSGLYEHLCENYKTTLYKDILYLNISPEQQIVLFPYGVYVCWNIDYDTLAFFKEYIKNYLITPLKSEESERIKYEHGESFSIIFDKFILDGSDDIYKIAISATLAQNIVLHNFESKVESTIVASSSIPKYLAKHGKIGLSKKQIAKKIGELFLVKSDINLQYDLLDTPEFFWEYPQYERYYNEISKYLDIKSRLEVLNKKVEVIQELLGMLSNEQNHRYSSFLEWIIIILIAVEIVMGLYEFIAH
ncbi:MAG: RMD1 family protein [Campylobacterales bacterium]|nr:RMD1 family protein [Campylobacterales bacterium]